MSNHFSEGLILASALGPGQSPPTLARHREHSAERRDRSVCRTSVRRRWLFARRFPFANDVLSGRPLCANPVATGAVHAKSSWCTSVDAWSGANRLETRPAAGIGLANSAFADLDLTDVRPSCKLHALPPAI